MATSTKNSDLGNLITQSPRYSGEWMPVFIEPILLSGERITIAIAAVGSDAEYTLHVTLTLQKLKCLYGASAKQINGLIELTLQSLKQHLDQGRLLTEWSPPLDGFYPGNTRKARSTGLTGIVNQAIRMVSSIDEPLENESSCLDDSDQTKYMDAVRKALLQLNPAYKDKIQRHISLNDSRQRHYGFVGKNYIANYAAVANSPISFHAAMVKIMELEDLLLDNFYNADELEMIVSPPVTLTNPQVIGKNNQRIQHQFMEDAQTEAKKRKISCQIIKTPGEVAKYLHTKAA